MIEIWVFIKIQSRSMSDPTLSDICFKNKMAWVCSTLIFPGIQPFYVPLKKLTGMFRHRHGMRLINGLMTSQVMLKCPIVKKRSKWTRMMRTKMRKNQREMWNLSLHNGKNCQVMHKAEILISKIFRFIKNISIFQK